MPSILSWFGSSYDNLFRTSETEPSGTPVDTHRLNWASAAHSISSIPRLLSSKGQIIETNTLSNSVLLQLASSIPSRFMMADWCLLYSTAVHGISLNTLYMRTAGCGACLLVIKARGGRVFGGFCSEWRMPSKVASAHGRALHVLNSSSTS